MDAKLIKQISDLIVKAIKDELAYQKHGPGDLSNSIYVETLETDTSIEFLQYQADYGKYVDSGRKPGAKGIPISALIKFIVSKGIESDTKKARSIAFAMQYVIRKEGIPTMRSKGLAPRRTNYLDYSYGRMQADLETLVQELTGKEIELEITKLVKNI